MGLKVYTCTDHDSFWPVGCASVVIAIDEIEARRVLDAALKERGLKVWADYEYTLQEIPMEQKAIILHDGEY